MENVRNRLKIEFVKKFDYREILKQQPKLTFNGIHKSYEKCDSYTILSTVLGVVEAQCWFAKSFLFSKLFRSGCGF